MKRFVIYLSILTLFTVLVAACTEPAVTTTAPVIAITGPADGAEFLAGDEFQVTGTASASRPLASVTVGFEGEDPAEATLSGNDWSVTLTAPEEGAYTILATASDPANNIATATVDVSTRTPASGAASGGVERVPPLGSGRPELTPESALTGGFAAEFLEGNMSRSNPVAFEYPSLPALNRVIVSFASPRLSVSANASSSELDQWQASIDSVARDFRDAGVVAANGIVPSLGIAVFEVAPEASVSALSADLNRDARVRHAEPDHWVFTTATPNDPHFFRQWAHEITDAPVAWETITDAPQVRVAVVDTGVGAAIGSLSRIGEHPGIAANMIPGFDFVSGLDLEDDSWWIDTPAYLAIKERYPSVQFLDGDDHRGWDEYPLDEYNTQYVVDQTNELVGIVGLDTFGGHGTHVAGIVGAMGNDGVGVAGVAWNVQIQPIRALGHIGGGVGSDVLAAVAYAAGIGVYDPGLGVIMNPTPADVINMSLGGGPFSQIAEDLYATVRELDVLVVASAGNARSSAPHYPSDYDGVISVSSLDYVHWVEELNGPAMAFSDNFSNYGENVDISAPGGMSWNTSEALDAWDGSQFTAAPYVISTGWEWFADPDPENHDPANLTEVNEPIHYYSAGTSMSAPYVAGAAALLLGLDPSLSADDLEAILTGTATRVDDSFLAFAYGDPEADWDPFFGYGALNLPAAIAAVESGTVQRIRSATYVEAVDMTRPDRVIRVIANPDYSFEIENLPEGKWQIRAGVDVNGNGQIGDGGEYYGEFDTPVVVDSTQTITGDVSFILERQE